MLDEMTPEEELTFYHNQINKYSSLIDEANETIAECKEMIEFYRTRIVEFDSEKQFTFTNIEYIMEVDMSKKINDVCSRCGNPDNDNFQWKKEYETNREYIIVTCSRCSYKWKELALNEWR